MQPRTALARCCRRATAGFQLQARRCAALPRRRLLVALASASICGHAAAAQPARKVYRVGLVSSATPLGDTLGPAPVNPSARAFLQGLRELGYVEGQNLVL